MNQTDPSPAVLRPGLARGALWTYALALLVLPACGGDGGGTGPQQEPVASVTLSGAPADVVLAGTTVQLTATAVSAAGAALPNRAVTWQSSDSLVARVGSTGTVTVLGAGGVTITARSEGKEASVTLDARAGGQLGPDGGTLRLLDGRITVVAQPGALPFPVTVVFRPALSAPADPRSVPGTAFQMEPSILPGTQPVLLRLAYDPARLPAGVTEAGLQLYQVVDGAWRVVSGSSADTARNTVGAAVRFGGTYAVAAGAAASVSIDGALLNGAVYVGGTRPLRATALDARGDSLRGRQAAWSTSDPSRATVDASGNVTGHAAGTATITAAVDAVQASVTVTVLARPAASWRQTAEWGTLQGNGRHDGRVEATLDPASFRELWVKTIDEGARPVATGAGRVFVSTGFSSSRKLTAFDAATGTVSWSRTFPVAEQVSSPAFAEGRVYLLETGPQAALWSLNAADGDVRFTQPYTDRHLVGPAPVVTGGGVYLGGSGMSTGGVHRFDAQTGAETWQVAVPWMDGQSPAVADGRVVAYGVAGTGDGNGVTALGAADGAVAYAVPTAIVGAVRTPVLGGAGNVLAATGAQLVSIHPQTGAVAWSQAGTYATLPAAGGGAVYGARDGAVAAFRESDGSPLWTWTPPAGTPWGPQLLTDNLLFVSVQVIGPGGVPQYVTHALDVGTGKQVWSHAAGGTLALSADGTLFITSGGTLTAIAVR